MTKKQALKYLDSKSKEGYITHSMLLEIFKDDEEVPAEMMEVACYKPIPPQPIIIMAGIEGHKAFNEALTEAVKLIKTDRK